MTDMAGDHTDKRPTLPPGEGGESLSSRSAKARRRGAGPTLSSAGEVVPQRGKTALPGQDDKTSWRAARPVREEGDAEDGAGRGRQAEESKVGRHRMARTVAERERLLKAAGVSEGSGLAAVGSDGIFAFRCPACGEQATCDGEELGQVIACAKCAAGLRMPVDGRGKVVVVAARAARGAGDRLPELPDVRAADGPSGRTDISASNVPTLDEAEAHIEWGLKRGENQRRTLRSSAKPWLILLVLPLGWLVWSLLSWEEPRAMLLIDEGPDIAAYENDEAVQGMVGTAVREAVLRRYLAAGTVAERARWTREGDTPENVRRMEAYYEARGGYEPEIEGATRIHGLAYLEERSVGGQLFELYVVKFSSGNRGVYALRVPDGEGGGYAVDWDYAVGWGELAFADLVVERPAEPVLIRCYLRTGRYYADGFERKDYLQVDLTGPQGRMLTAYVPRGTPAFDQVRAEWRGVIIDPIGRRSIAEEGLDFTVTLRFLDDEVRRGFVIDEVLARGWILPGDGK